MFIRSAQLMDANAIATIHVDSWRSAYEGIIDKDYLQSLSVAAKEQEWRHIVQKDQVTTLVVEDERQQILGWACFGADREQPQQGELYAIYLSPQHWHQGVGKLLMQSVVQQLMKDFDCFNVWVLSDNHAARQFYQRLGFTHTQHSKYISIGQQSLQECCYRWQA